MASNMAPPPLFKTPEQVAAESSSNNNDSSAQHVSHLPPAIDPSTASMTATKPSTLPAAGSSVIHPSPAGAVHPPAGIPPSLGTPKGLSQDSSDQWAARALDAIAPTGQGQSTSTAQPSHSAVSTPGLNMPGSFPRSDSDYNTTGGPDVDVEYVKQVASDAAATVVDAAKSAAAVAVPAVQSAVGYVQENGPAAAATTRDAASNAASSVASTVGPAASSAAGAVSNTASNAAGTVGNTASNAAGSVSNTASNAAGSVGNTMAPVASSVGSTAGSYGSTMREYAASAGDAIKPYVPASVAGVLPTHVHPATGIDSLAGEGVARLPEETRTKGFPSHDDEGSTPLGKTAGVGALPGSAKESGVAVLPDEKNKQTEQVHSTRAAPFHGEVTLKDGPASGLPSKDAPEVSTHAPVTSVDKSTYKAPIGPDSTKAPKIGTPTHIPEGKMHDKTYTAPVGPALPPSVSGASQNASTKGLAGSKQHSIEGMNVNTGTVHGMGGHDPANHHPRAHMGATLAEINTERSELGHPVADNRVPVVPPKDRVDSDRATTGHGSNVTATSFTSVDNGLSHKSGAYTTTDTAGRESAGHRTKETTAGATSGAGNVTAAPGLSMGHTAGVHPETHPTYGKDDGSKAVAAGGDHSTGGGSSTLGKSPSPAPSSDSKGEKKPGFMSRLKGEAKVISGKFGHNEAKIEEGRKMMGKN